VRYLTRLFEERAEAHDPVAVIDDDGVHHARALIAHARHLADLLADRAGHRPTVLVEAENSWRTFATALAVGRLGGTLAVASGHTTAAEFAAVCEDVRPDAVIAAPSTFDAWRVPSALGAITDGQRPGALAAALDGWRVFATPVAVDAERWGGGVLIGLTSGSTGRPKGVVQSEAALRYAAEQEIAAAGLRPGEPVAAIVPLSSTAAFCFGVCLAMLLGGPLVMWRRWEPAAVLPRMRDTGARWTMGVPTQILQLAAAVTDERPFARVRAITTGGGPMDLRRLSAAEERLGTTILRVYGMSECLGHTSPRLDDPPEIRLGRDGRPFPGTELRVVGTDGQPLPVGEPGAAQVRGPSLFLGYAAAGAVRPPELTAGGFYPTGDLMVRHDDGTISVTGRSKDVIIRGGRNIDVIEVERAIADHPGVAEVCVVPVADELLGERVAALVVAAGDTTVTLAGITAHLERVGLAKTKWPEFVYAVEAVPQTRVGKVARQEAKLLAASIHATVT
jgi:acyl-CoA synthetase (AMP-forming)/AMP-acid ligase II